LFWKNEDEELQPALKGWGSLLVPPPINSIEKAQLACRVFMIFLLV